MAGLDQNTPLPTEITLHSQSKRLEIAFDDGSRFTLAETERLLAEGVRMVSFADKEPTLEDVFMLVTKGAVA